MAEKYMFFNSTATDRRKHQASDLANYWRRFLSTGLINNGTSLGLQVVADANDMNVKVSVGDALIFGHLYINDSDLIKQVDGAHATLNRIDRIVLRYDNTIDNRFIKAFVLKGVPSSTPEAPPLTRNDDVYELSLAKVNVVAGKSFIGQSDIIDERLDESVCGLATSLSQVPTDVYNAEWREWFDNIQSEVFITKDEYEADKIEILETIQSANEKTENALGRMLGEFWNSGGVNNGLVMNNGAFSLPEKNIATHEQLLSNVNYTLAETRGIGMRLLSAFTADKNFLEEFTFYVVTKNASAITFIVHDLTANKTLATKTILASTIQVGANVVPLNQEITRGNVIEIRIMKSTHVIAYSDAVYLPSFTYMTSSNSGTTWSTNEYAEMKFSMKIGNVYNEGNATKDITPAYVNEWSNVRFDESEPVGTNAAVDILDASGNVLMNDIKSLDDISTISALTHKTLKLRVTLKRNDHTIESPSISDVSLAWEGHQITTTKESGLWIEAGVNINANTVYTKRIPTGLAKIERGTLKLVNAINNAILISFEINVSKLFAIAQTSTNAAEFGKLPKPLTARFVTVQDCYIEGNEIVVKLYNSNNSTESLVITHGVWEVEGYK